MAQALGSRPRQIPSRYFYDAEGSRLFERITELPEYYLTRAETALLATAAETVVGANRATDLIELGSGAATKTRILLEAMLAGGDRVRYVPFDVDETVVRRSAAELTRDYPSLTVHGIVGDFLRHLEWLPPGERRLVAFLGSTIGNLNGEQIVRFLRELGRRLTASDRLLIGFDLVKRVARIEAAYNDAQGITARFNRNALRVVNRRFGGDFQPRQFDHRARFDRANSWIEMQLVARAPQRVRLEKLDLTLEIEQGEAIRTEISGKFRRPQVASLLTTAGLVLERWETDPERLFALALARRAPS